MNFFSRSRLIPAAVVPFLAAAVAMRASSPGPEPDFRVELDTIRSGVEGNTQWSLALAGVIPGDKPRIVALLGKAVMGVSDVYLPPRCMESDDLGRSWSELRVTPSLQRRAEGNGAAVAILGLVPKWNPSRQKLLGIGTTAHFIGNGRMTDPPESPAYSIYDASHRSWSPWAVLAMPAEAKYYFVSQGGAQRIDLANGRILLPVYFKAKGTRQYITSVIKCTFDGASLTFLESGSELTLPFSPAGLDRKMSAAQRWFIARQSGLFEPSLALCQGRFFLTMRNAKAGYVTRGDDGLHFAPPKPWTFDDGTALGSDNTQTRWLTHGRNLFLVYTRRGANNDHVFRHRAPLFLARVDPLRLCVIRATERILVPEGGASLGNFSVAEISDRECWVTTFEDMNDLSAHAKDAASPAGRGANNRVYVARVIWP